MSNYLITGGKKLHGSIKTHSAKNAALAAMYACLLADRPSTLTEVPRIEEVNRTIEVFYSIGIKVEWVDDKSLRITPPKRLNLKKINFAAAVKTRAVNYLMGILIHKYKNFDVPRCGGCRLGSRTVMPIAFALEKFGIEIKTTKKYYKIKCCLNTAIGGRNVRKDREIIKYEAGDGSTIVAILAAVLSPGTTTIRFASANYSVQDLCYLLNSMGAKIENIGTTTLKITGVKKINGAKNYPIMPDPIVAMLLLAVAATTKSSILIKGCPKIFIELELLKMERMGFKYKITKEFKSKNKKFDLIHVQTYPSELTALPDKIHPMPYPGLNIDNLPYFVPIAAVARGTTLIHDWVYDNRAIYYMELTKLGAEMIMADPHRVYITGPVKFWPAEIVCPPALRPASLLVIAMLAANGKSIIRNSYAIDRGFENLFDKLKTLGADIEKI